MMKQLLAAVTLVSGMWLATPASADQFFFTTGEPDGLLGALSAPASTESLETETADDFVLTETTVLVQATITGLIPSETPLADIENVEVEIYHVFPKDSDPPSGKVPTRSNSPADREIESATRDASAGTLEFIPTLVSARSSVLNTVVNDIHVAPNDVVPASGEVVQVDITFTSPILLPADRYFFRPEVQVAGGDFLYMSAPKPIPAPADLQAWIRNSDLKPDWLRIGTDIVGGRPAPTFNMTFSLTGETAPGAGTPGRANCHGKSISSIARQFGGLDAAASALGFSSVAALQDAFEEFCEA